MPNHILQDDRGLKIATLVNDFGAINIDAQMVVGVEGEAVNLSNGCICYTIRGDVLKETFRLRRREDPSGIHHHRGSGVSDPIAAANIFLPPEIRPAARRDSILVVVDADPILTLDEEKLGLALDLMSADDLWDRRSSRMAGGFPATGGWSRKEKVSISRSQRLQSADG